MKTTLWIVIVVVVGIVGALVGYAASSGTSVKIGQAHASDKAKAAGEHAGQQGSAGHAAPAAGGYAAEKPAAAAGYGGAEKPAAAAGYGGAQAAPAAAGYGGEKPAPKPKKPAAAGY